MNELKLTFGQMSELMREGEPEPFYVWMVRVWDAETHLTPFVPELPLLIGI